MAGGKFEQFHILRDYAGGHHDQEDFFVFSHCLFAPYFFTISNKQRAVFLRNSFLRSFLSFLNMRLYKLFYRRVVRWLKKTPHRSSRSSGLECSSSKHSRSEVKKTNILGELEQVFRHFDADGDGKISVSELGAVINSLAGNCYEFSNDEELEMVVREADCDGDGFLHLQQFLDLNMKSEGGGLGSLQELRDAFLIFDADRNGYISAEELRSVLGRMGDERSHEDCLNMIRGADQDGDGYVDFEEFRMMMMNST